MITESELARSITCWIKRQRELNQLDPIGFNEETDLIVSGVLDSLGFIELMFYLETITEEKIDLSNADPKDFTTIKGLCRTVLNHAHLA